MALGKFLFEMIVDGSSDPSTLMVSVYQDACHEFSRMIHVGHVEEFAEADDLVTFLVDALESLQEILGPVYALVSSTTAAFQVRSFVTGIIFVLLGLFYHDIKRMRLRT